MPDINDIVEQDNIERFYVFRGHKGARAIELVYDGHREVFNEPTNAQSLVKAKLALRALRLPRSRCPSAHRRCLSRRDRRFATRCVHWSLRPRAAQ
jgi:hypothetical protein